MNNFRKLNIQSATGRCDQSIFYKSSTLLLCFLVILFTISSALAQETKSVTIKLGHPDNETDLIKSTYLAYTSVFKRLVEAQTRFKVQIFPSGQLGDLRSMAEQVSRGVIEMSSGQNGGLLASFDPNMQILEMPYTFQTTETGRIVLNGSFGKDLSNELAAKSNIRILSYLPSSFRNFSNSKREIKTPADMKGLKMRTMQVPIHLEMVKALGASPTPISFEELYSALQTGVVDGQENAPYVVLMAKLQEVQKFYTLDHHLLNTGLTIINDKFYKGLSSEERRVFEYASREAAMALLGLVAAKESQDIKEIEKAGVKVYTPTPAEYEQFKQATKDPVLKVMKEKVEAKWIDRLYKAIEGAEKQVGQR